LRLLLTILACFALTKSFPQTSAVSGYVLDLTTKKPLAFAKVKLQTGKDKNHDIVATTITDSTGVFVFENINPGIYSLSCFYKMPYDKARLPKEIVDNSGRYDIDSNLNMLAGQTYHHNFYLLADCPYDKTKDQDYCPLCKKKDMVQEILWGLPVCGKDGKWIVRGKDINAYYLGGCSPDLWCNPAKHCKRCNIDF
jgi:hypothetical protein